MLDMNVGYFLFAAVPGQLHLTSNNSTWPITIKHHVACFVIADLGGAKNLMIAVSSLALPWSLPQSYSDTTMTKLAPL